VYGALSFSQPFLIVRVGLSEIRANRRRSDLDLADAVPAGYRNFRSTYCEVTEP
jgi:hypothetical protein